MKLPASNKTSNFTKPLIKKGYYAAQLLKVDVFTDKEGKPKIGNFGKQLIFEFAIYKTDPETGAPIEPMTFKVNKNSNESENVIIPKFVYYEYIDKQNEGQFKTALTPDSKLTKLLEAMGWTFSLEGADPEEFIGNWIEANIDDFEFGKVGEKYTASTMDKVSEYKGPKPSEDMVSVKPKEKSEVKKQMKHKDVEEEKIPDDSELKRAPIEGTVEELKAKIKNLEEMNKEGHVTDKGLKDAKEQLESQIEELNKK